MNSNVIKFPQEKINGLQPSVRRAPDLPRYFCLQCGTDQFKLYSNERVHCANCGAYIRNVEAVFLA